MSRAHAALGGAVLAALLMLMLGGCAALPMPFQPANTQGFDSSPVEGSWVTVDALDTLQTRHLREVRDPQERVTCNHEGDPVARVLYGGEYPNPNRVLITNILLATVHTMVASWLDDKIAAESAKNDAGANNNLGPWYVGRVAFHVASLAYSAGSVINNLKQKCGL